MRYVGGKSKIATAIADIVKGRAPEVTTVVEPFMGGGAVTAQLAKRFDSVQGSDFQLDLVLMWEAVLAGWEPPTDVSESEYAALRISEPSPIRGFVGFGGSFGGKFFGGYARGGKNADGTPRNHQGESARAVNRIGQTLRENNVTVSHSNYLDVIVPDGAAVYCDPPYANSQGYVLGDFDSEQFWNWANQVSEKASVFVSEYGAPDGWVPVWSAAKRQSITMPSQGREIRREMLFVRGD